MTTEANKKKKRRHLKKKRLWLPITIIVLLIVARLLLPYFVKNYVNKTLANIPGYYGQVEDIDIALWRGAYVIHGLYLNKLDGVTQVPFLNFEKTDISIEWDAILDGKIVDNKGQNVISYGEIVKTSTLRILSDVFKIKKPLTILRVSKKK